MRVASVEAGGVAALAGIEVGDALVDIDGDELGSADAAGAWLRNGKLTLERGDPRVVVTLDLAVRP